MTELHPIETPIGKLVRRAHVRERLGAAWPDQPTPLLTTLTAVLMNPHTTSDALLTLADALGEAAQEANLAGQLKHHAGLTALRHLLQEAAPDRADVPLQPKRKHSA